MNHISRVKVEKCGPPVRILVKKYSPELPVPDHVFIVKVDDDQIKVVICLYAYKNNILARPIWAVKASDTPGLEPLVEFVTRALVQSLYDVKLEDLLKMKSSSEGPYNTDDLNLFLKTGIIPEDKEGEEGRGDQDTAPRV